MVDNFLKGELDSWLEYSVDMVRIKGKMKYNDAANLSNNLYVVGEKFWTSSGYKGYRYNHTVNCDLVREEISWNRDKKKKVNERSVCYIGLIQNNEIIRSGVQEVNVVVEYNPNKVDVKNNKMLKKILEMTVFKNEKWTRIVKVDLAVDIINTNINELLIDKERKFIRHEYFVNKDDRTVYLGKGDGLVKVYNKKIESGLPYECTRIEITLNLSNRKNEIYLNRLFNLGFDFKLPYIRRLGSSIEDKTVNALTYAVMSGYDINKLTRRYKESVKEAVKKSSDIEINKEEMKKALEEYVYELKRECLLRREVNNVIASGTGPCSLYEK